MAHQVFCSSFGKAALVARTKTHAWVADSPAAMGGEGVGPTPFDLLLSSLGACMIVIVGNYARQAKIPLERMSVDLEDEWRKVGAAGSQPANEEEKYYVKAKIRVQGNLGESDLKRLRNSAARCPVKGLLDRVAVIEETIEKV